MKKFKFKHLISLLVLAGFAFLFYGSATQKKAITPLIVPDYSFSPTSPTEPGSAGIRIALFNPLYAGNFVYSNKSPFKQFRSSMGKDLEQILTARGYVIKGPYDEYDLMTYSDKTECELGLFADIDLNLSRTSGGWDYKGPGAYGTGNLSTFEGTITLSGKITLYVSETFTRQKLMVKSLSIPQQIDIPVKAEATYQGPQNQDMIPLDDPGVHNPVANALSDFYKSTMKRAWDLLPKEDLVRLKAQVPKIREDNGFQKH